MTTPVSLAYDEPMSSSDEATPENPESPLDFFLSQPAYHAEEGAVDDVVSPAPNVQAVGTVWSRTRRWFTHFMFEKEPSPYSSIAPRTADGKRTKIFFFNGSGRGR